MSALGQKQTSRHLQPMSALPPKADIGTQPCDVRFVPKADIGGLIRSPPHRAARSERGTVLAVRSVRARAWRGARIFRYAVWTFRLLHHCLQIYNRIMPPGIMPATILRHAYGIYRSAAMLAGMQLDLFTPLKNGPMSAATLANALSLQSEKLRPLLYALVDAELLTLVEDDHFANTPEAEVYLVRDHDMYLGSAHELYSDLWTAALAAGQSIRAGRPKAKHDFTAMSDEELGAF